MLRIYELRVDILVQPHQFIQIIFEFCKLCLICFDDLLLL